VKRFYVSVTHGFDSIWSANITSDAAYSSSGGAVDVYIKKAFLQAKLSDAFVARLGSADLPWVPFVEDLYGYRYVENVIIDRLKFGTSADWGLNANGKVAGGLFGYSVSVVNGNGYKNPTRSNSVDAEGRIDFEPLENLTLAIGGYDGKLGQEKERTDTAHTAQRFDALAAYVTKKWRLGVEYFYAKDFSANEVLGSGPEDKADGVSVWGDYRVDPRWAVFARYDHAKPSKDVSPDLKDDYLNVGVAARPLKGVDVALVYKYEKVENGVINTSNGKIGGVGDGKYNEIGVWAQVAF
jgi:predicted porin